MPHFFKKGSRPPSLGGPRTTLGCQTQKWDPKGWGQERGELALVPTLWDPIFGSGVPKCGSGGARSGLDPQRGSKRSSLARAWGPKGPRLEPSSSPEEPKATRAELREKNFSLAKNFSTKLQKPRPAIFLDFFFKNFDGHLELDLCFAGKSKNRPEGTIFTFSGEKHKSSYKCTSKF